MRRKHYNTRQLKAGYKQCNYCGETMPSLLPCKCTVTITFRGDLDVIEETIARMQAAGMELVEADDEYKGGVDTAEMTITAVFLADDVPAAFREAMQ